MMNMYDVRDALVRSWWLVLLVTAICTAGALAYASTIAPSATSRVQVFVAGESPTTTAVSAQRVQSYLGVAQSGRLTAALVAELGLDETPASLGGRITATSPAGTVVVDLTVRDRSPEQAQIIARALGYEFIRQVRALESTVSGGTPVRLSISVPASVAAEPRSPTRTALIAGLLTGLAVGLLAAFARWAVDTRVWRPGQLARWQLTPLAVIPHDRGTRVTPAQGLSTMGRPRAEGLRQLRTSLRLLNRDLSLSTVLVSSATPGEGKTSTTLGLAMALADDGADVVVVEADVRCPSLAALTGIPPGDPGLSAVLTGAVPLEQALRHWSPGGGASAIRVLPCGSTPPNPSELLGGARMQEVLEELRTGSDLVLVDASPLVGVADGAVLVPQVDGVLLVARMRHVTRDGLDRTLDLLARANGRLLGVVANAARERELRRVYGNPPPAAGAAVDTPAELIRGAR